MNRVRTFPITVLLALVGVCISAGVSPRAFARRGPEPPLNPKTHRSPSGEFSLFVNPSDRQGRGSARYRLLKGSREVWQGELPFTLRDVRVLDDGTAAGYGYTLGPQGFGGASRDDRGEFVIAILDPRGNVRLKKAVRRGYGPSFYEDQYPQPEAKGLFADPENDRLIVLVADPEFHPQNTAWQQYRLSTGESLSTIDPEKNMAEPDRLYWCHEPRPVPGTPLTLVQWYRMQWHCQPGTGCKWVRCYEKIVLADPKNRAIKTIERRPDGNWLVSPDALTVARDGSMVIFDLAFGGADFGPALSVYAADGKPVRMLPAPVVLGRHPETAFGDKFIAAIG